jgi:hypothetical protein
LKKPRDEHNDELGADLPAETPAVRGDVLIGKAIPALAMGTLVGKFVVKVATGELTMDAAKYDVGLPSTWFPDLEVLAMIEEVKSKYEIGQIMSGPVVLGEMWEIYAVAKLSGDMRLALTTLNMILTWGSKLAPPKKADIEGQQAISRFTVNRDADPRAKKK